MNRSIRQQSWGLAALAAAVAICAGSAQAMETVSSYAPVANIGDFKTTKEKMEKARPAVMARQMKLLKQRYVLDERTEKGLTMSGGKPQQVGVRVKLPKGVDWDDLSAMSPAEIRDKGLFPAGFLPLPHPNHAEGGMLFPQYHIDAVKKQSKRDLQRFDLDYDLPDHFLPEYPPPLYLTTRPDLGDVSQGKLISIENYFELFNGILNPKQLEGVRLLVTPTPQQQFNATNDRRSERASLGVACFDCHVNGHSNAATHLLGDIRPQPFRLRIDTPSLRGVNVQRLFGSKRALKTVEDFTQFEQRAAYFDGDPVIATKKGVNILERGSQVHFMAEFESILDFPPAPKLDVFGQLDPAKASGAELRGQDIFFGKGRCSTCHTPPYYTDNQMHDLQTERFFKPVMINGRQASIDGKIKTFPLRGVKDTPPYLHDGRLLTLEDTVEFFSLILQLDLNTAEKGDLVAFLRTL